jgi:hypothetical protein
MLLPGLLLLAQGIDYREFLASFGGECSDGGLSAEDELPASD